MMLSPYLSFFHLTLRIGAVILNPLSLLGKSEIAMLRFKNLIYHPAPPTGEVLGKQ